MEYRTQHRLVTSPVKNFAIDSTYDIYYMNNDRIINRLTENNNSVFGRSRDAPVDDFLFDHNNNLYIVSQGNVDVMKTTSTKKRPYIRKDDQYISYITKDIHNNIYVLANDGKGDKAYKINSDDLERLSTTNFIHEPFAVDSKRNFFFKRYMMDYVTKYPLSCLYNESINSVYVDRHDNAYFATNTGIFVVYANTYDAVRINLVKVPNIVKISGSPDDTIYFSSTDQVKGGLYSLPLINEII